MGVVFGIIVGCGVTNFYWSICLSRRERAGEVDRAPQA
jgi:hypothetical protein